MKKRKYTHYCAVTELYCGRKRITGKKLVSPNHKSVEPHKKSIGDIYKKYYKSQVEELYRAIKSD
ncbi:MAG: hypothetical protein GF409_01695 [Candidatus Omnitrophica bacterium]|nr:hypothetical protein [Candidatus Omnitrophota bacterium]